MDKVGFVLSDKNRRAVFLEAMGGPSTVDRVTKRARLIRPAATRAVEDLAGAGLLSLGEEGAFALTAEGESISQEIRKQDLLR